MTLATLPTRETPVSKHTKPILVGTAAGVVGATFLLAQPADAQPVYAVRAGNDCDSCHVEPSGWSNPELKARECSLNCQTCHVSPTGGGMRTSSGRYYGREMLPLFGHRPSADAKPIAEKTEGKFRLLNGFSGWSPGTTSSHDIPDRYGKIPAEPMFDGGGDARLMAYFPIGGSDYAAVFPMQFELYGMARPWEHLVLYADAGMKAHRSDFSIESNGETTVTPVSEWFRVREVFAKIDHLPYNSYVRAGRFNPPFGWRLPDHTSFIRRSLGFDQDRQVFGVEGGINPNYLFAEAAVFKQGVDWWPGDSGEPGWGVSATGGYRELGWQAGASLAYVSEKDGGRQIIAGPLWALNAYPIAWMAEVDIRHETGGLNGPTNGLYGYQEVQYLFTRGVAAKLKFDWLDPNIAWKDDHQNRITLGADFHPYTGVEIEPQYRRTYTGGGALTIGSEVTSDEFLIMTHAWL